MRNLTSAEIVAQVMVARDRLGDFPGGIAPTDGIVPSGEGVRAVSNIVFMGMGEPLYNFENVRDAIGVLTDGLTPWPPAPPRGVRVVVGLMDERGTTPEWADTVLVGEAAR